MRNLFIFFVTALLLLSSSAGISQKITYSRYWKATLTTSYVPLFIVGFVVSVAGLNKHNKLEEYSGNPDAFPDILSPMYKTHLILCPYFTFTSAIGAVQVGYNGEHIFGKVLMTQSLAMGATIILYRYIPWSIFISGLYDLIIPFITARQAYNIDKKFLSQNKFLIVPDFTFRGKTNYFGLTIFF